ncbi:hypothetical protein V7S43_005646 [Phytophthora oleae]|uniref:Uncharacterized protein n=1 Tax=Phytophthora oleae TaxID=2107226 RepID=A0ABD3FUI2_9STRA
MDNSLPSYEAAMREARAYLRRRDLSSQDEIPLYFAWQRLYAAANANLSTDFLQETRTELRARQDARLTPRRGIPPPLFTSFDKVNRNSAQASAFLRTGTSSQAAIEMMARRYRRDAEKLRSSREKLVDSIEFTRKPMRKAKKRQKSPQGEVDELLESLEGSELSEDEDQLSKTKGGRRQQRRSDLQGEEDQLNTHTFKKRASTMKNKLGAGGYVGGTGVARQKTPQEEVDELLESLEGSESLSEDEDQLSKTAKGGKREQRRRSVLEDEEEGLLGAFEHPQTSKKRASTTKNKIGAGGYVGGIGVAVNPVKAAELRRSSSSKTNPAVPPFATVANVAAFAAQVSDWRMPPDIDRASSAPELSQKGAALKSTMSGKRLSGANELREPGPVEGEGDMTLNSSGGFELDEDNFDPNATFNVDAARISSTASCRTAKDKSNFNSNQVGAKSDGKAEMARDGRERPTGVQQSQAGQATRTEFQQKLVQLSRAVGDMEVKIQGRQVQVTFHGELNAEEGSTQNAETLASSDEKKQSSPVQKTFDATGRASVKDVEQETNVKHFAQGRDQAQSTNVGDKTNVKNWTKGEQAQRTNFGDAEQEIKSKNWTQGRVQANVPRKLSNVRFADTASSDDYMEDLHVGQMEGRGVPGQQQMRGASVEIPPVQAAGQPRQLRSSGRGSTLNRNTASESVPDEESDEETKEEETIGRSEQQEKERHDGEQVETGSANSFGSRNLRQQMDEERQQERSDEDHTDGGAVEDGDSSGERPDSRHSVSRRVETQHQDARTGRNGPHSRDSLGNRKLQQMDEEGQHSRNDKERMDEDGGSTGERQAVSQSDRREGGEYQDARTDRSRSGTRESRPHSLDEEPVDNRQSVSQRDRRVEVEHHGARLDLSRSGTRESRPHSRNSGRGRTHERNDRSMEEFDKERSLDADQNARPKRDQLELQERLPHTDNRSARERNSSATERLSQQKVAFDQQSFSDASEDESDDRTSNEQEGNSGSESFVSEGNRSSHSESSTRASSRHESVQEGQERLRTPRQSHNQSEEISVSSVSSDEDLSDGSDALYKQQKQRHHASSRQSSQLSKNQHEKLEKRRSSSKRSNCPPEFSGNSEVPNSRDNSSSDEIYCSRSRHSTRNSDQHRSRYSSRKSSRHFPPAVNSPPKRSKKHVEYKSESKSRKTTWKLPKGIVWPPGMEAECVARLGLDGHHPIAPPGLEHLVTEEQWGEYWTWLHWYSSWQMWYMKNDKKPKKKAEKEKRRRRDDDRKDPRNANWWVDAGSSKHRHRRERHD